MIDWKEWNTDVIKQTHGDVYAYRKLYDGDHIDLFPRAQRMLKENEVYDPMKYGETLPPNVKTPYIQANISKLICEIPAMFVSRSIGKVKTSVKSTEEQNQTTGAADGMIEGPDGDLVNDKIDDLQQELIDQISKVSKLAFIHWQNIVQHQIDGGLVGVPFDDDRGLRIDFKKRDVYYPHEDEMGVDLAFHKTIGENEYLHVYRERVEVERDKSNKRNYTLKTSNMLFKLTGDRTEEVEEEEAKALLKMKELNRDYPGRSTPFVVYWANEPTYQDPYGQSCLKGQLGKQDEINWTFTKNSMVFTKNGDPKIAVSREAFRAAQEKAIKRYGEEAAGLIDHRDFNIITYDKDGKAIELIQLDITKIGSVQWIKDLMKAMLMETKTSEKAIDFYMEGGNAAQSGTAKFYDLLLSIIKAEQIQAEYVHFLQQLFENCLWLANDEDENVVIEEPEIELRAMIPISKKELSEENSTAFSDGVQSLETTVRRMNPHASEEWILEEIKRINEENEIDDNAYPEEDSGQS
ncbi:hypothetical protein A8F95_08630 [Bacillus wudalianchiensis]|uniref:Phage portal protein n=2 Tax=Pseudobacillus wudalianchiensis TaxID=1743143 RepID=A0A1B9ATW1_9BACI|nr:hypothetical protein A8F95_08630 [Bacillus wudalianchiensis]